MSLKPDQIQLPDYFISKKVGPKKGLFLEDSFSQDSFSFCVQFTT